MYYYGDYQKWQKRHERRQRIKTALLFALIGVSAGILVYVLWMAFIHI